jgi:hypothetical protein
MGQRAYQLLKNMLETAGTGHAGRIVRTRVMLKFGINPDSFGPDDVPDDLEAALRQLANEQLGKTA